jgi:TolB-like protein
MGAYLVSGFVALEGVDQLVSYEILTPLWYRIALIVYLFGVPGSLTIAWFHGAKGQQRVPTSEIVIHVILAVLSLTSVALVVRSHLQETRLAEAAAASGLEATSLAVLYFEDLSGGELEYVADGLTESLIDRLSEVRSLDVVSKNAVAPYRGTGVSPDSVARVLGVGSLIRGSVETDGDELRITARLVDGLSGADIDRRVFGIPTGEYLLAGDSLAENVARILRRRLGEEVRVREIRAGTGSVEAWSLTQRAQRLLERAEDQQNAGELDAALSSLAAADTLLGAAEAADGTWARPPAMRARLAFRQAYFVAVGAGDFDEAGAIIEAGLPHAEQAVGLDAGDAYAIEQRGSLRYLLYLLDLTPDAAASERMLDAAQADLEAAVAADPTLATAYSLLSHLFYQRLDNVSVVLNARRAYEEDAYLRDADRILGRLFWAHYDLEQFRDARTWCDEGSRRFPDNYGFAECHLWLLVAPTADPAVDDAIEHRNLLAQLAPESERPYQQRLGDLLVAGVLRKANLPDSAEVLFARGAGNEEIDPQQDLLGYEAAIRAITGDPDRAIQIYRRYLAANPNEALSLERGLHWWWRGLNGRPGFEDLLER